MKKMMKISKFLWLFLSLLLVFTFVGSGWSQEEPCTIMQPDRETRLKWIQRFENAPKAYIDEALKFSIPMTGSLSLLSHLNYVPADRNQGSCGNCWAWAGTGVMEINLDVNEGIFDRLSVQYLNSCYGTGVDYACCGGWLSDVADFYTTNPQAIPWSNTNASWADGARTCGSGSSLVSCASISTSPNYPITSINEATITTHGVSQATAIQNIRTCSTRTKPFRLVSFWQKAQTGLISALSGITTGRPSYGTRTFHAAIPGTAAVVVMRSWLWVTMTMIPITNTGS